MKVGLPASLVRGENSEPVDVLDLNIHGMAFQSEKFFTPGTRLEFRLPFKKKQGTKKFPGEVMQCNVNEETLDGSYRVGVRFLFGSKRSFTGKNRESQAVATIPHKQAACGTPTSSLPKAAALPSAQPAPSVMKKSDDLSLKNDELQKTERVFGLTFIRKSRFYFLSSD